MAFTRSSVRSRSGPPAFDGKFERGGRTREDEILVLGKKLAFFDWFFADAPLDLVAEVQSSNPREQLTSMRHRAALDLSSVALQRGPSPLECAR